MTGTTTHPAQRSQAGQGDWRILAVVLVGAFMAVLDTTIVNVALPSIARGVHASSASLEWVVSGYALTFGLALVPAGRLGDRLGFKQIFVVGLGLFTVASVACGISQNPGQLITARMVQGLGAGIYYPAISATIQRLFTGPDRSRAFGYLGGVVGISTAAGPLIGGLLIQAAGMRDGWRWVFLVNLFIGAVELPVAIRLLPRRHEPEDHQLDPIGNILLILVLLFLLFPLVEGRVSGWPAWSWLLLRLVLPAASALAWWELLLYRRGGEPVIQVGLMRHRAFWAGQCLALLYFAGFTSLFFTLSILWQKGLGRGALATGLLVVPFSVASLVTAANSYRFSRRFGRVAILAGITAVFAGLALVLLALHLGGRSAWDFTGPLLLAGLGNGVVIAPNQDFVLAAVPREQAGTAGGALITAQRLGSAIGIAVVGTALFGGGGGSGGGGSGGGGSGGGGSGGGGGGGSGPAAQVMPSLVPNAQWAIVANLAFIVAAWCFTFGLPRRLSSEENTR